MAFGGRDGQRLDAFAGHELLQARHGVEGVGDAPRHHLGDGGCGALERNVRHLRASAVRQQRTGQVRRATGAGGGIGHVRGPGHLHDVLDRVCGRVLRHHHHSGQHRSVRHRHEILQRIGLGLVQQDRIDDKRGCGGQQRVAVGLGLRHGIGGDLPAGAGAVLHQHRLAQRYRHVLRQYARVRVQRAAGCKADKQLDGPGGVGLRPGGGAAQAGQGQGDQGSAGECHGVC